MLVVPDGTLVAISISSWYPKYCPLGSKTLSPGIQNIVLLFNHCGLEMLCVYVCLCLCVCGGGFVSVCVSIYVYV